MQSSRQPQTFAEAVAQTLEAATDITMMIVDIADGADRMRIVEVGGVNSWGVYGADPVQFVQAMEAEAIHRHQELWG